MPEETIWAGALAILLLTGAALDVTQRRLPNWLILLVLGLAAAQMLFDTPMAEALSRLAHAAIALVVGMILFRFRMIGGGDAKFYAALAAHFALAQAIQLLLFVSLAGLVTIGGWFALRRLRKSAGGPQAEGNFAMVPYGVAIALGGLALLALRTPMLIGA